MNTNLKEISTFIKKNNSYSDYNLVNDFMSNLNYTKINYNNVNNNLFGGNGNNQLVAYVPNQQISYMQPDQQMPLMRENSQMPQFSQQMPLMTQQMPLMTQQMPLMTQVSNIEKLPDMYLQNPSYTTEEVNTYTIKEGTILYHATSNKKGFNKNQIDLGKDKLINFFTPNFRLASDKIEGCSIDKQNGFIHVFRVVKDIPNIYVKLPYDIANDINSGLLANEFCSANQNYYGIGFFYPKNNIEMFSNNPYQSTLNPQILGNPDQYYSEFGLCNPKPYLEYLYSQRCQSLRKLSEPYRFD